MLVGLIDVDGHNFPNLCLMKLSAYYKAYGRSVEWYDENQFYDVVFMSKVFSDVYTKDIDTPKNAKVVIRGGVRVMLSGWKTARKYITRS